MEIKEDLAIFSVNITGSLSKSTYMGQFTVKCLLSPIEEISADKRYRELLGENPHLAQENVRQKAFALAQLEQRISEMPPFFENDYIPGGHIKDHNVLLEILDFAIEAQETYIKQKEAELKERQARLTKAIKKKKIEKKPEIEVEDKSDQPEEIEIDGE